MLSEKSEQFLMSLRLELLKRGKKEDEIEEVVDELRDHLHEAEQRGENVDDVTGGSVNHYIKTISKEMAFDKGIIKTVIGALFAIVAFFLIPRMVSGQLDLSMYRIIFYGLLTFVLLPLELWVLIEMLKKYGNSKKGYIAPILVALGGFLIILAGEFLLREYDGESVIVMEASTIFWLGVILSVVFILVCLYFHQWFYIGVLVYLVLPDLFANTMTDAAPGSKEYINVSTAITLILTVLALVGALAFYARYKKNS